MSGMMSGLGGLFELILVVAALAAWGIVELRGTRLDKRKAEAKKRDEATER